MPLAPSPSPGGAGGRIIGSPVGSPVLPPFFIPAPPIGSEGNCAAGIGPGEVLRQVVVAGGRRFKELSFDTKSMSGLGVTGRLQVRVVAGSGTVLAAMPPALQVGGAGAQGFQRFRLALSAAEPVSSVAIEFTNLASEASLVAVDAVELTAEPAAAEPVLDLPVPVAGGWRISWTATEPAWALQRADRPDGPWSYVPTTGQSRVGDKLSLVVPEGAASPGSYIRTIPAP